jgi:transglutaminase-like putative cysteine protease
MWAPSWLRLLPALVLLALPLQIHAAAIPKLAAPPEGERWFSINVGGERVGFAHQIITRAGDGYRIESDSSVKMKVMGFSREATSKDNYLVGSDLAIRSFATESIVDGSPINLTGEATPQGVKLVVDTRGGRKERTLKTKGAVYPDEALNLYPLLQGTPKGKTVKIPIFDPESGKVKQIKVEVIGRETLPSGVPVLHLRNNLYPMVDNDIWVDLKGNTIKESVRDDLVLTLVEDEKSARQHLAEAAVAKKDLVLDFSLIPIQPPIDRPEQLKKLAVEFSGVPIEMPLLQGKEQLGTRLPGGKVLFTMPNPAYAPPPGDAPTAADLESTPRINKDAPETVSRKNQIVGKETDPAQVMKLLAIWVAKNIKGTVADAQSSLETLRNGSGNCQGHTRLYAALARAAGIPTRFVSGWVYAPGKGFLYHSWAESYLSNGSNGWIPVDPTFGEVPANLTHVKLVQGDTPEELGALAGVIGRVQAKVVDKQY